MSGQTGETDLARVRNGVAELIRLFEGTHGISVAWNSGVTGELSQAYEALRRAQVLAEKLDSGGSPAHVKREPPE